MFLYLQIFLVETKLEMHFLLFLFVGIKINKTQKTFIYFILIIK